MLLVNPPALPQVRELMRTQAFIEAQQGRFVVALSLQEAENLRGCLHLADKSTGLVKDSPTTAALRLADGTCLDSSWGCVFLPFFGCSALCLGFVGDILCSFDVVTVACCSSVLVVYA